MRKTKIVCTLGPACDDPDILRRMMEAGMNVARFNFSHGTHEEQQERFDRFDALRRELSLPVAALLDTKGPEIRLKTFANKKVQLEKGQLFTLRRTDEPGDETGCGISYERLYEDVQPGCTILLDDGLIGLTVGKGGKYRYRLPGTQRRHGLRPERGQPAWRTLFHALSVQKGRRGPALRRQKRL